MEGKDKELHFKSMAELIEMPKRGRKASGANTRERTKVQIYRDV